MQLLVTFNLFIFINFLNIFSSFFNLFVLQSLVFIYDNIFWFITKKNFYPTVLVFPSVHYSLNHFLFLAKNSFMLTARNKSVNWTQFNRLSKKKKLSETNLIFPRHAKHQSAVNLQWASKLFAFYYGLLHIYQYTTSMYTSCICLLLHLCVLIHMNSAYCSVWRFSIVFFCIYCCYIHILLIFLYM